MNTFPSVVNISDARADAGETDFPFGGPRFIVRR